MTAFVQIRLTENRVPLLLRYRVARGREGEGFIEVAHKSVSRYAVTTSRALEPYLRNLTLFVLRSCGVSPDFKASVLFPAAHNG